MQKLIELFCGISIPETTIIGRRLNIEHFGSIIIHGATIIGDDCIIRQGVTIGNKSASRPMEAPRLGNRVDIGAGAKILGPIVVGDGAVIGANAVVTKDVMENAVMAGIPAQLIRIQATPGQGSAD
jgi:serine O-acetyltransferase